MKAALCRFRAEEKQMKLGIVTTEPVFISPYNLIIVDKA